MVGTSNIALERVQALLHVEAGDGSLYNHLVRVVHAIAEEKPQDALAQLEKLSRQVKQTAFVGAPAPEVTEESVAALGAEEERRQRSLHSLKLLKSPSDPTAAPRVLCAVQNFLDDAAMFEWAGVGFGRQESFRISLSLRKLAADVPALQSVRLWGKILGRDGDYYVAEGELQKPPPVTGSTPPLPGTPEYEVEKRGEGANNFTYWVASGGSAEWVQLPTVRANHIVASRNIKHLLSGNLNSPVESTPWFPGQEQHLLRVQIARISATCTLAMRGWYEVDEEAGVKNAIKLVESPLESFPGEEELLTPAGWVHASPFILSTGRTTWPDLESYAEGALSEEQTAAIQAQIDAEPEHAILESIEADLEDLKPEDVEGTVAWNFKVYGDEGLYTVGDAQKTHRVTAVRSTIWPGAITVAQGSKFANLYVGYAMKCGTLVPPQKESGLPLRGTMALMPLVPDDIMDEPKDLEEQEEPNPIQDEADSDKGDVDDDPDAA